MVPRVLRTAVSRGQRPKQAASASHARKAVRPLQRRDPRHALNAGSWDLGHKPN